MSISENYRAEFEDLDITQSEAPHKLADQTEHQDRTDRTLDGGSGADDTNAHNLPPPRADESLNSEGSDPMLIDGSGIEANHGLRAESIFGVGPPWTYVPNTQIRPWRGICHLAIVYDNGATAEGTGWLASPDTVITAGHNVFSQHGHGWARSIGVYPGRNGAVSPYATLARSRSALPGWTQNLNSRFDLGALKLQDRTLGHKTGWFGIKEMSDQVLNRKPVMLSAGYPGGRQRTLWYDRGPIRSFDTSFVRYRMDTLPGNSGGPIFVQGPNQTWVAIATHVYGGAARNLGIRLRGGAFDAIVAWINA